MALFILVPSAHANSLFTVENITVDVTAEDSVKAQEQAFDKAQAQAFEVLSKRLISEGQAKNVATPDSLTLSTLVKDYEVTNEQLSAVRYKGTYTFRFHEKAISKLFSLSGVSYTQTTSKTLLVLPVLMSNHHQNETTIWSEDNWWLQAWSRGNVSSRLVPIEVPIGDLADISDIDDHNALRYQRSKLDRMLARYNAKEAAIVIADPSQLKHEIIVSIYRTDRGRAEFVQKFQVSYDRKNNESNSSFYDRAVKRSVEALQKDWKRKTAFSAAQNKNYTVRIPIDNLKKWINARQSLVRVPGVSNMELISLTRIEAHVSFTFRGDEKRLRETLARSAMTLGQRSTRNMYDLHLERKRTNNFYRPAGEQNTSFQSGKQTF